MWAGIGCRWLGKVSSPQVPTFTSGKDMAGGGSFETMTGEEKKFDQLRPSIILHGGEGWGKKRDMTVKILRQEGGKFSLTRKNASSKTSNKSWRGMEIDNP